MRKIVITVALLASLAGCSVSNRFEEQNGICYRTRTEKFLGIQYSQQTVGAVPQNCGL